VEYALRYQDHVILSSPYCEVVAAFIEFLEINGIKIATSATVSIQAERKLFSAVKGIVDRVLGRRGKQVRVMMFVKCRSRLRRLWKRVAILSLQGDPGPVENFYRNLLKNPLTKAKLEKLRDVKTTRTGLMPDKSDMQILSEAIALKERNEVVYFVSKDGDFCEFPREIYNAFSLKVLHLSDLSQVKRQLETQIRES